jgi:EpsD family peptidyl-prolyl cis-trans isomerase
MKRFTGEGALLARGCVRIIPLLLGAAVAAGCGKGADDKLATQVAAKVNGDEITVHQINHFLARSSIPPESVESAKRQVLERLIDQQLAKQQALERKLDRAPAAVMSIEAARNEILARAYQEHVAAGLAAPTDEEVRRYYEDHPELFAQRKLFGLEEIHLTLKGVAAGELKEFAAQTPDLKQIAGWLKSRNAAFGENRGVRAAEQLPLDWLPRMQRMKSGEIQLFESGERLYVVRVAGAQAAPIDEAAAKPRIRQFLANRRLNEAIAKDTEHLREKSNIEYVGEFFSGAPSPAPAEATPKDGVQPGQPTSIEKGVRGLR